MATFRYILRDTARLLTRHFAVVFLTLLTIIAVFLAVGMSILLSVNVTSLASQIESDLTIEAYLKAKADVEAVMGKLAEMPQIKNARYVSPEEALKRLDEKLGQGDQIISLLGDNPLPPSVIITVDRAENLNDVAREVEAFPEVEDAIYAGEVAERLASLAYFLNRFALAVFVIALVTSLVVMMNTIRIALYSRREEIGVMLLVGATPTYVSLPFLLQGVILGGRRSPCGAPFPDQGLQVAFGSLVQGPSLLQHARFAADHALAFLSACGGRGGLGVAVQLDGCISAYPKGVKTKVERKVR